MPERFDVRMQPVRERREEARQLLAEFLRPNSSERVDELIEEGGVAIEGYNRQAANAIRNGLHSLGVEATVVPSDSSGGGELPDELVGRVRDTGGTGPIEGAEVTLRAAGEGTVLGATTTDERGRFRIPEFGSRVRDGVTAERPDLDIEVVLDGRTVRSRTKGFDWEAFAAGDYVFEIEAEAGEESADSEAAAGPYRVSGTVTRGDSPVAGVTVRAFDLDLGGNEPLGSDTTDDEGAYTITYGGADFRAAERGSADVVVRVYDEAGGRLAESEIRYNVGRETTVDVQIPAEQRIRSSEYGRLRAELDPLLGDRSVPGLSEEQLEFLQQELELSERESYPAGEETVLLLRTAADLATRTPFDERILYALVRRTDGVDRASLARSDPSELAEEVAAADEANVVDVSTEGLQERLARKVDRLQRAIEIEDSEEVETTVRFRTADGKPLAGGTVRVRDPYDERKQRTFATGDDGTIAFSYVRPADADDSSRRFRLTVINEAGITIHEETVPVDPDSTTEVTVTEPSSGFSGAATLEGLRSERGLSIPELDGDSEVTLGAIRRAGGVENLDVSATLDVDERESVDALATLDLLTDPETGSALVEHGYTDQQSIAETSFTEFQSTMEGTLDPKQAATIHTRAQAQTYLLDSMAVDRLTARRNGTVPPGAAPSGEGGSGDGE